MARSTVLEPIAVLPRDVGAAARARPAGGYSVERVDGLADVRSRAAEWTALGLATLHGNPVGDAVMVEAALAHLARPGDGATAVLVRHDGAESRLVGAFVFRPTRVRWGLPILAAVPWAHKFSFTSAPLVHRDHARETFAAFFDWLDGEMGGVPVLFDKVPAEGPLYAALEQYLIGSGRRYRLFDVHKRAVLDTGLDADAWLAQALPNKKRKELRRQRKRLDEMGGLAFARLAPGDDVAAWCDDFMALEAAGWKGRAGSPLASDPALGVFVRTALTAEAGDGRLRFWKLTLAGRPVAMTFAVARPPQAWLLKIAHDEELARFSPGVQLMLDVTRDLIADPDIAWVDSCADAGHPMIDHLWRGRFAVADLLVAGSGGLAFDRLCDLEALRRRLRAQAKRIYRFVKEGVHR
jgi:CelD/BcsL family acetyltransferase involved in cellulose biosynthesis